MKYNTTYYPRIGIKQTLHEMQNIKENINEYLKSTFNLINVPHPIHLSEDSDKQVRFDNVSRRVSYDLSDNFLVVSQLMSHTNWLRGMFDKVEVNINGGFIINPKYVFRDKKLTPTSSPQTEHIIVQVLLDKDSDLETIYKKASKLVYEWIFNEIIRVSSKYKIKNIFEKNIEFITSQMMENEYGDLSPKNREFQFAEEKLAYLLEAPGKRLLSGNVHSDEPVYTYDLNYSREIIMFDKISYWYHKVARISILASGQTLSDQLNLYNQGELKELPIFKSAITNNKKIMEIDINLTNLLMVILQKGHISEVSPGSSDFEAKIIKDKYKVPIL